MVMWTIIMVLLVLGLLLLVAEIIFIPGTTFVGLLGAIFTIVGICITYSHFGREAGLYTLGGTIVITLVALVICFKAGTWNKFALKDAINSKVNDGLTETLHVGDEGVTSSTLRPMGKAEFNNKTVEVKTLGYYLEQGCRVRITSINIHQITVEPITTNHL
jgi:membrane-bound ClpP family serine protease